MKISARNKLEGTISAVKTGPVNTEVVLDLAGGDKLVAVVTTDSAKSSVWPQASVPWGWSRRLR